MNKRLLIIAAACLAVVLAAACALASTNDSGIKPVYHTADEWSEIYKVSEYHENKEITGDYDPKLAAECENGTFVGLYDGNGSKVWRGIPFGKIPARFERSVDPDTSDKVYEAYYYGKSVMQPYDKEGTEMASHYEMGDLDCLTLAIYSGKSSISNKPVLVYIHGGGWAYGGTADCLYYGSNFVYYNPDMIVVDITYRTGMMGQINLGVMADGEYLFPDYEANEDVFETSINNGILDQIQALRWIKANISAFGGDPDNVTICGESAGGGSVAMLALMASDPDIEYIDVDEGLFKRVISMSGGFNQITAIDKTETLTKELVKDLGVKTIEELQNLDFCELRDWWSENNGYVNYCAADGKVIPLDPFGSWCEHVDGRLTIMSGATTNEFAYYRVVLAEQLESFNLTFEDICRAMNSVCTGPNKLYPDFETSPEFKAAYQAYMNSFGNLTDEKKVLEFANDYTLQGINYYMAEKHAMNGGACYTYSFDQPYDGDYSHMGAAHAVDCHYLFGNFNGGTALGTDEEVDLSIQFMKMVAQFCKTGNPSVDGREWKAYDADERNTMFIKAGNIQLIKGYNGERFENLVKMYDTNPHFQFVDKWNNTFKLALYQVHGIWDDDAYRPAI